MFGLMAEAVVGEKAERIRHGTLSSSVDPTDPDHKNLEEARGLAASTRFSAQQTSLDFVIVNLRVRKG